MVHLVGVEPTHLSVKEPKSFVSAISPQVLIENKKKLATFYSRTGESRTTLDDGALDCRVRNGNGYDNSSMVTSKKAEVGN